MLRVLGQPDNDTHPRNLTTSLVVPAMDLESASAAFTKFESQSLAELLAEDVELEACLL